MERANKWKDILFLVLFILSVFCVYFLKIKFSDEITPVISYISDLVEFLLTFGIGIFLQKIFSFQELRQFAISAYTRVSDIKKVVNRLSKNVQRFHNAHPQNSEMDVITVSVENLLDTLESSKTDWAYIIGKELATKDKIYLLEKEESQLKRLNIKNESDEITNKIEKLEREINNLESELPYVLRSQKYFQPRIFQTDQDEDYIFSDEIYYYYDAQVESGHKINFSVKLIRELANNEKKFPHLLGPFVLRVISEPHDTKLRVFDMNDQPIGDILNPLSDVDDEEFVITFYTIISYILKYSQTMSDTPSLDLRIEFPVNTEVEYREGTLHYKLSANILAFG